MRVLLLDDDPAHVTDLAKELATRGCEVVAEPDGATGLVRAVTESFDAVVVSAELPGMNAFRLCGRIKRETRARALRVFLAGDETHRRAAVSADEFLVRPVRAAALFAALEKLVPPAPPTPTRRNSGVIFSALKEAIAAQPKPRENQVASAGELLVAKSRARSMQLILDEQKARVAELESAQKSARVERDAALEREAELARRLAEVQARLDVASARLEERDHRELEERASAVVSESAARADGERRAAASSLAAAGEARANAELRKEIERLRAEHRAELEAAADVDAARQREIADLRDNHARAIAELASASDAEKVAAIELLREEERARHAIAFAELEERYVEAAAALDTEMQERAARHEAQEQRLVQIQTIVEDRLRRELEAEHMNAMRELQERHEAQLSEARFAIVRAAEKEKAALEAELEFPVVAPRQRDADLRSRFHLDDGVRALRLELDRARRDANAAMKANESELRAMRIREENLIAEMARKQTRADVKIRELQRELAAAREANASLSADFAALEADAFRLSKSDPDRLNVRIAELSEELERLRTSFAMTEASLQLAHQEEAGALRAELEAAAREYAGELARVRLTAARDKGLAVEQAQAALRAELEERHRVALEASVANARIRAEDEVLALRESLAKQMADEREQHAEERDALAARVSELVAEVGDLEAEIGVLRAALVAARQRLDRRA